MEKLKAKFKYTTLDISYLCKQLSEKLHYCRLNNIYDINNKQFLLKFGKENVRENLFIESGLRIHTVKSDISKKENRSIFCNILRKNLKNKRIESIEQIGLERVIKLNFGDFYLFVEFYSKGNIILTDTNLKIIIAQRQHEFNDNDKICVGNEYPLMEVAKYYKENYLYNEDLIDNYYANNENNKKYLKLSFMVNKLAPYCHQGLATDVVIKYNLNPDGLYEEKNKLLVIEILNYCLSLYDITSNIYPGFVIKNKNKKTIEFTPILINNLDDKIYEVSKFDSFNDMLEDYFNNYVNVKVEEKEEDLENKIWKKYEKIKEDQNKRLENIKNDIDINFKKGQLIEQNINEVQGIIDIINGMVASGMSAVIKTSIKQGQEEGDELALLIKDVKLEKKIAIISLDADNIKFNIDIDLETTAVLNSKKYYELRNKLIIKEKKTEEAATEAMKKAKTKALKELKTVKKQVKKEQRKLKWFEKFHWFVSSENFLVISAKDALQNEVIIKKYLEKNDIVMHAQIQGSPFTLIKYNYHNYEKFKEDLNYQEGNIYKIPQLTLQEAAMATLCLSKAWRTKIVVPVFWVESHQVSKTAPTGLFLPTGSFMIYGKKNFINLNRMEMGFGFLFLIKDEYVDLYKEERNINCELKDLMNDTTEYQIKNKEKKDDDNSNINNIISKEVIENEVTKLELMQGKGENNKHKNKQINTKNKKDEKKKKEIEEKSKNTIKKNKVNKKKKQKIENYLEKYGDLSKEEQNLRNQILGIKQSSKTTEIIKNNFEWKNEDVYEITGIEENNNDVTYNNSNIDEPNNNNSEEEDNNNYNKQKNKYIKNKQYNEDDGKDDLLEHQNITNNLRNMTPNPKSDDHILEILPVGAPFTTLKNYKYRVKMLTGNTKRGKAFKNSIEIFLTVSGITPYQRELIKKITEVQIIHQVMGDCKLQAAGLTKIQVKQKNMKKKAKKDKNK